jgi:hypothetical protein
MFIPKLDSENEPLFKKRSECEISSRQPYFMWFPTFASDGSLHTVIQLQNKTKKHKFNSTDNAFMTLIGALTQLKLQEVVAKLE